MANYLSASGNSPAAMEHMRLASTLEPGNPLVIAFASGDAAENDRLDEAIELQRSAVAADPLSVTYRAHLASSLYLAGRFEESQAEWLEAEKISPMQARQGLCRCSSRRANSTNHSS